MMPISKVALQMTMPCISVVVRPMTMLPIAMAAWPKMTSCIVVAAQQTTTLWWHGRGQRRVFLRQRSGMQRGLLPKWCGRPQRQVSPWAKDDATYLSGGVAKDNTVYRHDGVADVRLGNAVAV